jgi:hypothetical protein
MHLKNLALISLILLLAISCSDDDDPEPACDTDNVSYSADIAPVIQQNCWTGCHNGSNPLSGFLMEDYAGVKAKVDDGRLLGAIRRDAGFEPMPQDQPKLDDCTIDKFASWIAAGAPNN